MQGNRYRTVWISDVHLGAKDCKAQFLLDFLRQTECETLYLVGDLIDFWQAKKGWAWNDKHTEVVQEIINKGLHGTRVIYVPGNHDEIAREYTRLTFGGVEVVIEDIHETIDGRQFLVVHGDMFDAHVKCHVPAWFGDLAYDSLLWLNRTSHAIRNRLGLPFWSLAGFLKDNIKQAASHVERYEVAAAYEARRRQLDGVICGHIHKGEMRFIDDVLYCNDGDWVENCTALVEHSDGRLELVQSAQAHRTIMTEPEIVLDDADLPAPVHTMG